MDTRNRNSQDRVPRSRRASNNDARAYSRSPERYRTSGREQGRRQQAAPGIPATRQMPSARSRARAQAYSDPGRIRPRQTSSPRDPFDPRQERDQDLPSVSRVGRRQQRENYDRDSMRAGYVGKKGRTRKKHRRRKVILISILAVLVLLIGAGSAYAVNYLNQVTANLQAHESSDLASKLTPVATGASSYNVVLAGTDESAARDKSGKYSGVYRTDSLMLARVDTGNTTASLISIPRDTMVTLDGYGTQKINAAHAYGGQAMTVSAVANLTGEPVNHYAEIDFDGFCSVVDTLGGIEVNVPMEINDSQAGGHLDAGKQTLNGKQALILCRSRHTYDKVGSGKGDAYRAANQRLVLSAIAKKILHSDPITMAQCINQISTSITTDMSAYDILWTLVQMRDLDTSTNLYTASFPTNSQYINNVWYEVADQSKWQEMKAHLDAGQSPAESTDTDSSTGVTLSNAGNDSQSSSSSSTSPTSNSSTSGTQTYSGTVMVKNGSGKTGVASSAKTKLQNAGFTVSTGNANSYNYTKTLVIYNNAQNAATAKAIAGLLGTGTAQANDGSYTQNTDYLVVLGSDYTG